MGNPVRTAPVADSKEDFDMGQSTKPAKKAKGSKVEADRSHYAEGEEYPVRELAVATGISTDDAEALIEKHGLSNGKAAEAAREMQRGQVDEQEAARQ